MTKSRGILPPRRRWTEVELELLRRHYPDSLTADLATVLERPVEHVYAKANHMGLLKSEAFAASDKSGRILKGGRLSVGTQFKPGVPSWSKGTKGCVGVQPACRATQFAAGHKPQTWKPIGTLRINADGYLDRKVSDTGYGPRDWVGVHRLVWTAVNGPVPEGHVICFLPGRRTTDPALITLDALELVSRGELAKRNHPRRYGPEFAQITQLRGAITRQINKRTKEAAAA